MIETTNKKHYIFDKKEVHEIRKELEDAFCLLDNSTDSNTCYSLEHMKKITPKLAELYSCLGGS